MADEKRGMILFVQPFGLGQLGGGARILRGLLKDAPRPWLSVVVTPNRPPPSPFGEEIHVPCRRYLGRLERSRFAGWAQRLDSKATERLEVKLNSLVKTRGVSAIHSIAHFCWDTIAAFRAAQANQLPFFLSVHDDPAYCLKSHPFRELFLASISECWQQASARFVISGELGAELCKRWGTRHYVQVTDGVTQVETSPRPQPPDRLAVYFMGLMHLSYEPNFVALQQALTTIAKNQQSVKVSLTTRCGPVRRELMVRPELIRVLPFGCESDVQSDFDQADVLYQPLSFARQDQAMNAFSLSTKMISYLAAGLPVLFHGPLNSAAGLLLQANRAAIVCDSNEPRVLAEALLRAKGPEGNRVVLSALNLAQQRFRLVDMRALFWGTVKS